MNNRISKPFFVTVTFTNGQMMFFQEHTRTRAINIAKSYGDFETVESAIVTIQDEVLGVYPEVKA